MKDNLFTIFGTSKIVRIFSPSLRNTPFNGIEWSFLAKDLGYDEDGMKYLIDDDEDEEAGEVELEDLNKDKETSKRSADEQKQKISSLLSGDIEEVDVNFE